MVQLKEMSRGFEIKGVLKENVSLYNIAQHFGSQVADVEHIGKRVTKAREMVNLFKYKDKLYREKSWAGGCGEYTVTFWEFSEKLEETEPFEDYKYYIEYCNPAVDDEEIVYLYFKEDELKEAQEIQKEYGEELVYLKEIEE